MIDTLFKHRSVRKYKPDTVSKELLDEILHAGARASTTGNMQVYSIVVTTQKETKEQLLPLHFNQQMIVEAPVVLTFCADFNRFSKWCKQRKAEPGYNNFLSFVTASIDALLAAQNVCVAAEEKGLGICYLGTTTYNADKIIDVLELPELVVPITTVVLGYPQEVPELTDRLPIEGIVHFDKYTDYSSEDIDRIYADKEAMELYQNFVKENNTETLAQVFTNVRYKKADNEFFSEKFLETIKKQGFM
jgi:nitroreductase